MGWDLGNMKDIQNLTGYLSMLVTEQCYIRFSSATKQNG